MPVFTLCWREHPSQAVPSEDSFLLFNASQTMRIKQVIFIQAGAFDTGALLEAGQAPTSYHDQPGTET